jgi:tRNA threonylcarbamoyladenosine biosynthesis protein TsaB
MKILALEFSSEQRSAAVVAEGRLCGLATAGPPTERATRAFALIEAALREAGLTRDDVDCLAVGVGPGSYTGIRVGIALAQGWQLARGLKLLAISSAQAVAAQARAEGVRGRAHVAIDAQRQEVYLAAYDLAEAGCGEVSPLRLASFAELESLAASGEVVLSPDLSRWALSGRETFPTASQVGLLAVGRTDFVPGEALAPIYLRATTFVKAPPPRRI